MSNDMREVTTGNFYEDCVRGVSCQIRKTGEIIPLLELNLDKYVLVYTGDSLLDTAILGLNNGSMYFDNLGNMQLAKTNYRGDSTTDYMEEDVLKSYKQKVSAAGERLKQFKQNPYFYLCDTECQIIPHERWVAKKREEPKKTYPVVRVYDRSFVLGPKIEVEERDPYNFTYYSAKVPFYDDFGDLASAWSGWDWYIAECKTSKGIIRRYGRTREEARAFLRGALMDDQDFSEMIRLIVLGNPKDFSKLIKNAYFIKIIKEIVLYNFKYFSRLIREIAEEKNNEKE